MQMLEVLCREYVKKNGLKGRGPARIKDRLNVSNPKGGKRKVKYISVHKDVALVCNKRERITLSKLRNKNDRLELMKFLVSNLTAMKQFI